jgi:CHAT domain-containing protein/Tfp pilus assembly protein PilF
MKTLLSILIVCFILSKSVYAQFGNLIKKEGLRLAKKEGMNMLSKELNKTKAKFDSTSFSYAISLSDKAAQFESKDKLADVVTLTTLVVDNDRNKTGLEEAREMMDMGEMFYSANGFKLAEVYFASANLLLLGGGYLEHPLYGRGLANLGLLYNSMGRFAAAETLTVKALDIREKYRGHDSRDYAASLNNLAVLNKDLGNYNEAEKEITEAIEINRNISGDDAIAYGISLNNRGVLYQVLGRYTDAEADMNLALQVAAKTLKSGSLQFTRLQSNLALLYQQQGKYEAAEEIYQKAVAAIAKNPTTNKKSNPDYAHMIENLASLYEVMGDQESAEQLYLEALSIYERKFDNRYSGYGLTSARLGSLYLNEKKYEESQKYLHKADGILNRTYGAQHPYTVDLQVQLGVLYWQKGDIEKADEFFSKALDKSLEFVGQYFAPMSETEKAMYWQTLQPRFERYYAFTASTNITEVTKRALQYRLATKAMLLSGTTKVKSQILQSGDSSLIRDYQTWLDQKGALAYYYAMSQEDLREQKVNLDSIDRAANSLEKSLSERSGLFNKAYSYSVPTVAEIQSKLVAGEKAVEMIRMSGSQEGKIEYLALILSPGGIDKVVLANGDELDGKYFKLYRNLMRLKKADTYSYNQYWQAIDNNLSDAKKVYLSPDGVYNQINVNSLQINGGQFAIDKREYINITSLRNLQNIGVNDVAKKSTSKKAVLVGNPQYGSADIDQLPGTGKEVRDIGKVLSNSGYLTKIEEGTNATESSIKSVSGQRLLHLATHGFFVADPKKSQNSVFKVPLYNINENVLLRSGLLFAGAGKGGMKGSSILGSENGILTSYEVLSLDLEGTELVVISACETGLGDIMSGEGVYGLQRAFMIAGASAVVMSLWKVDDEATQQLMTQFYTNWLKSGDMENAFREAQKKIRSTYSHPYYWGSFVLLQD